MNDTNTSVVKISKPDAQTVLLALIAFISIFQTVQLFRVSLAASSFSLSPAGSAAPASNPNEPESMVGGC